MKPLEIADFKKQVAKFLKKKDTDIKETSVLLELVGESLILVDLMMSLQEIYPVTISMDDVVSVKTVSDLHKVFASRMPDIIV